MYYTTEQANCCAIISLSKCERISDLAEFKVVEGRKSSLYNHFAEYELVSCRATETRLMGVVALKLSWQDPSDAKKRFYQIIHLDYSEYGIDEYLEFDCLPESKDYAELRSSVQDRWNQFINVMGGSALSISASCMLRLLDSALELAGEDREREYDTEENIIFRRQTIKRLSMMREVLESRGISSDACSVLDSIDAVSVKNIAQYGTVNYFLMRLLDRDFDASSYLSDIPRDELEASPLASHGIQSLMKSSISKVPRKDDPRIEERLRMYNCRITTLSRDGYYHISLSIWLSGGMNSRDAIVKGIEIGSMTLLSDYEAAVLVSQGEYITVFDLKREMMPDFDPGYLGPLAHAYSTPCENGILYTIYNDTNEHVEKAEYRLSDDVYGYALLSIRDELILMSPELDKITMLDEAVMFSAYTPYIMVKGRFRVDSPLFHTLCHTQGLSSDDLLEPVE